MMIHLAIDLENSKFLKDLSSAQNSPRQVSTRKNPFEFLLIRPSLIPRILDIRVPLIYVYVFTLLQKTIYVHDSVLDSHATGLASIFLLL